MEPEYSTDEGAAATISRFLQLPREMFLWYSQKNGGDDATEVRHELRSGQIRLVRPLQKIDKLPGLSRHPALVYFRDSDNLRGQAIAELVLLEHEPSKPSDLPELNFMNLVETQVLFWMKCIVTPKGMGHWKLEVSVRLGRVNNGTVDLMRNASCAPLIAELLEKAALIAVGFPYYLEEETSETA